MDFSNRLAVSLFFALVAVMFVFLIGPSMTATLTANQANPAPATGMLVLVMVWVFPILLIAGVIAHFAYKSIRKV